MGNYKLLDAFDWNHPKSIDRGLYEELHDLDFVDKGENALLRGTSGLGKTMLAQNLGLAALMKGKTVLFTSLSWALADLLKQESIPAFERRLRRYLLPDLLLIDELGYVPCDQFGLRVMSRDARGLPIKIARQSYCQGLSRLS